MYADVVIGIGVAALAAICLVLSLWMRRRGRRDQPLDPETAEEIQRVQQERDEARYRDGLGI